MGFLTGKTAIITGAGRAVLSDGRCGSIGYGIATAYAKEGANLVITGRNTAKLEAAKEELEKNYSIKVLAVQADVNAGADNEAVVNHVIEETIKSMSSLIMPRLPLPESLWQSIRQNSSILPFIQDSMLLSTI